MRHESRRIGTPVTFSAYSVSQCEPLSMSRRFRLQARMSSRFHGIKRAVAMAALLGLCSVASPVQAQVLAQSDNADLEMRIQQLENRLRQLTGQNEELQYRNRQLEDRLKALP